MWKQGRTIYSMTRCLTDNLPVILDSASNNTVNLQQTRNIRKHWDPKFKRLRRDKVWRVSDDDILLYQTRFSDEMTPEQQRARMLRMNIPINTRTPPLNIHTSSTNLIWKPYNPTDGDGKYSILEKAQGKFTDVKVTSQYYVNLRRIQSSDIDFNKKKFPEEALEIYKKAHEILTTDNKEDLIQYVTPGVYTVMVHNANNKTIRWKLLKVLAPPKMVQVDFTKVQETNKYGQITVRMHTEQQLSVYDRFGRLMQGSEILRKDVLEYVVFEKALGERNSNWRIVGKIQGKSGLSREPIEKTYVESSVKIDGNSQEAASA